MSIFFDDKNSVRNSPVKFLLGFLLLLVFVNFATQKAHAQNSYDVKGTVKSGGKKLDGSVVTLYKGSSQITQITTSSNGRFEVKMDLNGEYTLTMSKAGYITKKFYFNTKGVPDDRAKEEFGGQDIEVSLFQLPKDPNVVSQVNQILSQPMAKFYYDDAIKEIQYDKAYSQSMIDALAKLSQIEKEAVKKAEEEAKKNADLESAAASKYEAAIAKGDAAFGKKDYPTAKAAYQDALTIKVNEKYPHDQIVLIEKLIADGAKNAALDADYKAAITKADAAFTAKSYDAAKVSYNDALKLKPAEAYPKTQLDQIAKLLADAAKNAELNGKYDAAIAKADKALAAKTYDAAKAGYNEASGLKPSEKYPKDKLAEIDKALADAASKDAAEKALNAKYDAAIAKGDAALSKKDYNAAKSGYNDAVGLKPAEKYPKDKLAEIEKALADAAAKENADKELAAKYSAAIAKADKALAVKDYVNAKAGYNEALGLKSAEQYPKDKLAEIEKALADAAAKDAAEKDKLAKAAELDAKYKAAIEKGDAGFTKKDYTAAKAGYNEALGFKPAEKYPKDKLAEIDKAIADAAAAANAEKDKLAKEKELNDKYNAAIAKGDKALAAKTYDAAKSGYNEALGLKPSEQYPKDKLAEIEKALGDAAAEKDKLAKAAELDAKYKAAIAKADAALVKKDYTGAKSGYNEALGVKSAEQYPKDKIAEIDAIVAKEAGAKELDAKYSAAIAKADAALKAKTYDAAKSGYNEALGLKPSEKYPKDKLAEIDKTLADAAAKDKAEQDRLAKEKELAEKYDAAIKKADAALASKNYDGAKTSYNDALTLKSTEKYPKDKIAEIDAILAKEMGAKELEKKYADAIAKGDAAFGTKDYAAAKTSYNAALGFKPAEKYPKDKLAEIDKALADADTANKSKALDAKYQAAVSKADAALAKKDYTGAKSGYNEALGVKPGEKYPKDKLSEIEKALADADAVNKNKALDVKYQAAISKADAALAKKDYTGAKSGYNEALGIKSSEQYPKDKLAEIDKALSDADAANKNKALDAKYQASVSKADAALAKKDYTGAKAGYNDALGIKPSEQYPKDKIAEIDKIIADMASKDASAKEMEAKYVAAISKGDAAFSSKDYETAKSAYTDATGIKPLEKYPKDKLAEVEKALAAIAEANKGKDLEANYKAAIAKADGEITAKDYVNAKADYIAASGLKPTEQYPKDQVMKIAGLIANQAKDQAIQAKYDAAIAKADDALSKQDYANALTAYKEANSIKPKEPYPTNKIAEINSTLDGLARSKGKEKEYNDDITKGDRLFSAKDYKAAKNSYLDASLIKPTEQYPKDKIAECDKLNKKKGTAETVVTVDHSADFKSDLAKKYPEGITEESGTEPNAKVTRRIVVKGDEGHLYVRKETSFGPIYYFKDGVPIKEEEFLRDTEVQE